MEHLKKYKWLEFDDSRLYHKIIDKKLEIEILSTTDSDLAWSMVKEHPAAFSLYDKIRSFKRKVSIDFWEHEPFAHWGYAVPVHYTDMVRKEITRLVSLGILGEAPPDIINISAGFPVVKGDGKSCRICLDLRELNNCQKL